MKTIELRITRIGNSRGIRIPAEILRRYSLDKTVILEQRPSELALRPRKARKLSWKETYKQMAAVREDWSDLGERSGMVWNVGPAKGEQKDQCWPG